MPPVRLIFYEIISTSSSVVRLRFDAFVKLSSSTAGNEVVYCGNHLSNCCSKNCSKYREWPYTLESSCKMVVQRCAKVSHVFNFGNSFFENTCITYCIEQINVREYQPNIVDKRRNVLVITAVIRVQSGANYFQRYGTVMKKRQLFPTRIISKKSNNILADNFIISCICDRL